MADKFTFDAELVRQLAELLNETDLNEIEYEVNDHRIRVVRHRQEVVVSPTYTQAPAQVQPMVAPAALAVVEDYTKHPGAVKSPMVGNAYASSDPAAPPFVKEGDTVTEGQTLLIIEAMKVMNPIKATRSGTVKKIMFENSHPVEFDEILMIIE
jgi:acetyl-CoA carboxylase biotin carboxyl carrier protein